MASLARSLQCSLAIADLAKHIGGANQKDSLGKEALKELIQVLGTLGTEAAIPILSKFERQVSLFKAEKGRLREGVIAGIEPHEVQALLREAPIFSEGMWAKKDFLEAEKLSLERQQVTRFPVEEMAIARKRTATTIAQHPHQKRTRSSLPPNPVFKPSNQRAYVPPAQVAHQPKAGSQKAPRPYRQPGQAGQAKPQQAYNRPNAQQGGANKTAPQPKTPKRVNFKKPKKFTPNKAGKAIRINVKAGQQPFAPSTSASGSQPTASSAFNKR